MLGVCYYPEHWPEELVGRGRAAHARDGPLLCAHRRIRLEPHRAAIRGAFDWDWLDRAFDDARRGRAQDRARHADRDAAEMAGRRASRHRPGRRPRAGRAASARAGTTASPASLLAARARASSKRSPGATASTPRVAGWQTDNEYGCHDTAHYPGRRMTLRRSATGCAAATSRPTRSTAPGARCSGRWSSARFEEVDPPNLDRHRSQSRGTARLPALRLRQVASFNRMQTDIIRRLSPGRYVTHNFMGFFTDFDHFAWPRDLDFAAWDSYPLGFTERFPFSDAESCATCGRRASRHRRRSITISIAACGRGRWWVMEQQPGPVNWARYNPRRARHGAALDLGSVRPRRRGRALLPLAPGALRAGADARRAQPAAIRSDLSPGGREAAAVVGDLQELGDAAARCDRAPVALVFDYEADWVMLRSSRKARLSTSRTCVPLVRSRASARARRRHPSPRRRVSTVMRSCSRRAAHCLRGDGGSLCGSRRRRCLRT